MATAYINSEMLQWAMQRAAVSLPELAKAMKKNQEQVRQWCDGEAKPTFRQGQELARRLYVPFGFLFLDAPPDDDLPIPDFRRKYGQADDRSPSINLRDVISDTLRKQQWFADYQRDHLDKPLGFVGSFDMTDDPGIIAADMAMRLEFDRRVRGESQRDGFFREFSRSAQELGILVMKSGVVGNNNHRLLSVDEFRGFAISDAYAPAVFVNGNDAISAQIFTLAHELAHLWIGTSGISDGELVIEPDDDQVEVFCNRVAGELLVPGERVRQVRLVDSAHLDRLVGELAQEFRVSTVMVARQLWEHHVISREMFFDFYERESAQWHLRQRSAGRVGGDYYRTAGVRNSRILSEAVFESMYASETTVRDASRLLGVKPKNFERYMAEIGATR